MKSQKIPSQIIYILRILMSIDLIAILILGAYLLSIIAISDTWQNILSISVLIIGLSFIPIQWRLFSRADEFQKMLYVTTSHKTTLLLFPVLLIIGILQMIGYIPNFNSLWYLVGFALIQSLILVFSDSTYR